MNQFFVGNTLINDAYIGNIRIDEVIISGSSITIDYLVIAGGGGGGGATAAGTCGGGGGAGGLKTGSLTLFKSNKTYNIIVGSYGQLGGAGSGTNGENSSLIGEGLNVITLGGGGGGFYATNGKNGGSGGGGGGATPGFTAGGTGSIGEGNDGAPDYDTIANTGGGGGGAKNAATTNVGGSGSIWLDGVEYGRGGDSRGASQATGYGGGGAAPVADSKNGNYGTVIIRYPGTGSKVSIPSQGVQTYFSASYTYHRFFTFGDTYYPSSSFIY